MSDSTTLVPALYLRRTYAASPARLYEMWTTPDVLATFLGPDDVEARVYEYDVRAGGRFRIGMHRPEGDVFYTRGEFRELVPGRRIAMTWTWEEDDPAEEHETLLTLEFTPNGAGADLELTHAHLASLDSRERHTVGWNSILDKLVSVA